MSNSAIFSPSAAYQPWRMLLWLLLAQIMVAFIGRSLGPLSVLIEADLQITKAQIGLLPAALFLGQAFSSIPTGLVVDRFGSRPFLLVLSLCLGLSFLLMTMQQSFGLILSLIVLGGIGYGGMHPTTNRGIIYWFSQKQRGTAMGIKQMGITLGSALSAVVLLPLGAVYGWRIVVLIACTGLVFIGFLAFSLYRDPIEEKELTKEKVTPDSILSPMVKMVQNKALIFISIIAMGINGSQMCLNIYLVLFTYEHMGISLVLAGTLLVVSEVGGSLGRIGWGVISDRIFGGKRLTVMTIIVVITLIISGIVAFLPVGTPYWTLAPIFFFFGFTASGFNGIWMNLASEIVPRDQSGLSTGFSITLGSLGVIILPPIFGLLVDQTNTYMFGWLMITTIMGVILFFINRLYAMNVT